MPSRHAVILHPMLCFSGITERMLATAQVLKEQGNRVTIVSTAGTRARAVEEAGFEVCLAELPTDPRKHFFATNRTKRLLRRLEPDLFHSTHDSLVPLMSEIIPGLGVPWIIELHGPARRRLLQNDRNYAAAIVSSESLVESVVNHGHIPRSQVRVIRNAPSDKGRSPEGAFGRRELRGTGLGARRRIGCSGFLNDEHATDWFIEAARLMVLGGTRCFFTVLGEGPREGPLRKKIRDLGLVEHLTLGVPTTRTATETLAQLDIHVSCKVEGGPGWLACQALALGIPSVLAAAGDSFDLIGDRRSGILVEPGNPRLLADELTKLISHPDLARSMGSIGQRRMLEYAPLARFEYAVAEAHALALGTAVTGAPN